MEAQAKKELVDNLKFRCHYLKDIMTEPRSKSSEISDTAKSRLIEVLCEVKTGRKAILNDFAIKKGILAESDSITLYAEYTDRLLTANKNEERFSNEHITGVPDLIFKEDGLLVDIKTCADKLSFEKKRYSEKLDERYYWQVMGYLALTGLEKAEVAYVLPNTPLELIRLTGDEDLDQQIERNNIFDDLPLEERVFIETVERDEDAINKIYEKVEFCKQYITNKML